MADENVKAGKEKESERDSEEEQEHEQEQEAAFEDASEEAADVVGGTPQTAETEAKSVAPVSHTGETAATAASTVDTPDTAEADVKSVKMAEAPAKGVSTAETPEQQSTSIATKTTTDVPEDHVNETTASKLTTPASAPASTQPKSEVAATQSTLAPSQHVDSSKPLPSKPRPLSDRLISPPLNGRDRSSSPGRFPVRIDGSITPRDISPAPASGRQSPAKHLSADMATPITILPPAAIDISQAQAQALSSPPDQASPPLSGGMLRKASSGFGGLLGRMNSIRKTALSPPARQTGVDRRNSQHSASGQDRASTASLAAIADGPVGGENARPSLQDRFRTLREQEEQNEDDDTLEEHTAEDESLEANDTLTETSVSRTKRAPSQPKPPPNHDLPPGTASGMAAGPAKAPAPVNWDLWQTVVNEGPAAVARTSGEELSRAIASGIPAAIRGVVWQVLAESKSDELEALYKTLKTRGSDTDTKPPPPPPLQRTDSEFSQPTPAEKDSGPPSPSSTHSTASSNPAASSITTPSIETNTTELQHKLLGEKQKRESAALQKLEKAIKRDLGSRTSYSKFTQSAGLQDALFGVCKAYALFDPAVGYAQGINFIAMPLLFNMPEEEAFTLLVRLMHQYQVRTLFEPEMPGLHLRLFQFERLLEDYEPALYCHLKRRHVSPQLYATQWFLTLFAYRFPLQLVLRVYDLLFNEGLTAILKFGLVLMQKNRDALLEMKDMSQLTTFLKEKLFDAYIDKSPSASSILDSGFFGSVTGGADKELYRADELVQDATHIKIPHDLLHAYEVEWEEQKRIDHEREAELDNLRTSSSTLTTMVKTLEERLQQHDTEHVSIASDLVKYKVENDTLHDGKEALEMQVQELQKMVETQPAEVEQKLKEEMERIMMRNVEVQNQNRHLQDELENVEQQLVKISMTHAETQSELDTMRQKWNGVQAMMNGR